MQQAQHSSNRAAHTDFTNRFVFPYDAEDIRAHKWFKGVPWDRLHELDPPFVPMIRSAEDTQYFNDEEPVTDLSDSDDDEDDEELPEPEKSSPANGTNTGVGRDGANDNAVNIPLTSNPASSLVAPSTNNQLLTPPNSQPGSPAREEATQVGKATLASAPTVPSASGSKKRVERDAHLAEALEGFEHSIQHAVHSWLAVPYDSIRLRNFELQVDAEPGLRTSERDVLKGLVRMYGRKEKKRPRDKLLRDPSTRKAVLEERKKTAFLGYDWQRIQAPSYSPVPMAMTDSTNGAGMPPSGLPMSVTTGTVLGGGGGPTGGGGGLWPGPPPGYEHLAALQRGRLSMH